jgi:hypothetical protein
MSTTPIYLNKKLAILETTATCSRPLITHSQPQETPIGCACVRHGWMDEKPKTMTKNVLCHAIILFFAIFATRYPPERKPHKPRGRASDVSTISTCFLCTCMIYCPPTPPELCENGLGVSLLCTCAAFSPFCKIWNFSFENQI